MALTLLYPDVLTSAPQDMPARLPVDEHRPDTGDPRVQSHAERTQQIAPFASLLARAGPPVAWSAQAGVGQALPRDSGLELWIRQVFRLGLQAGVEACAALTHGAKPGSLVVRPVHLHAARDHLVLWPPEALAVSDKEASALFDAASAWLKDEPIGLRQLSPILWELSESDPSSTRFQTLVAASSTRARGRNIDLWLPRGPSARTWRRLMNEVQMLWHTHPVNERRASLGQHPVNALWLEGSVPLAAHQAFDVVASTNPVLMGVADFSGAQLVSPEDALERCSNAPNCHGLIDLGTPTSVGSGHDPSQTSSLIGSRGLASIRATLGEIVLTGEHGAQCFQWRASARWKLWRTRPRPSWLCDPPLDLH